MWDMFYLYESDFFIRTLFKVFKFIFVFVYAIVKEEILILFYWSVIVKCQLFGCLNFHGY